MFLIYFHRTICYSPIFTLYFPLRIVVNLYNFHYDLIGCNITSTLEALKFMLILISFCASACLTDQDIVR